MVILNQSASDIVRTTIERDGVVRHGLSRGLINTRALAREIELSKEGRVSFEAILSAIRRYPFDERQLENGPIGRLINKLSLKNQISVLSVRNDRELLKRVLQFADLVNNALGETFRMVASADRISVTVDSSNEEKLESFLPEASIIRKLSNLAEVIVDLSPEIEHLPGVLAALTTELAVNDVVMRQLTTVGPGRIIILVNGSDATKTYKVLETLGSSD